jgi:formamidopyrimidine-DNA glycosylase
VPELPEVESYRLEAQAALGRPIVEVVALDPWYLKQGVSATSLGEALVGRRFGGVRRIGKLLLLDVVDGPVVGIRFGMTGTLVVDGVSEVGRLLYAPRAARPEWERFRTRFADGGWMAVQDPRRLGGVVLDPTLDHLGPDALTITRAQLRSALAGSQSALKARLLDQSCVAGIGNLIADELLWRSGLSPLRASGTVGPAEVDRLWRQLARTLGLLMERGGSHRGDLMDQRHPGGRCPKDGTELVRSTVGGRTSWWCPVHQR